MTVLPVLFLCIQQKFCKIRTDKKRNHLLFYFTYTCRQIQMCYEKVPSQNVPCPFLTNKALYNKHASSQVYHYISLIGKIVDQKQVSENILYEDLQFLSDNSEYMKRFYENFQFPAKMFTFKEYYYYHQDTPRIFAEKIETVYSKWHYRKRDLIYKKLKVLSKDSQDSSSLQRVEEKRTVSQLTHFLLDISEYNPFSKKYYLRVQEQRRKKEKEEQQLMKRDRSLDEVSGLKHSLSRMLEDMSELSNISTLMIDLASDSSRHSLYHPKKPKINYSAQYSTLTQSHSTNQSQLLNTLSNFSFKKQKGVKQPSNKVSSHAQTQKLAKLPQNSRQKSSNRKKNQKTPARKSLPIEIRKTSEAKNQKESNINSTSRRSKLPEKRVEQLQENGLLLETHKSKSIFRLSSYNSQQTLATTKKEEIQKQENAFHIHLFNQPRKETLKLKPNLKPDNLYNLEPLEKRSLRKFESQKKGLNKIKSTPKIPQLASTGGLSQKIGFQPIEKNKSLHKNKRDQSNEYFKALPKQQSFKLLQLRKEKSQGREFSDKKLQINEDIRFRSHKSQHIRNELVFNRNPSPAKNCSRIGLGNQQRKSRGREMKSVGKEGISKGKFKDNIHLGKTGKKVQQLRLQ